jgi:dienelactone hydrolase
MAKLSRREAMKMVGGLGLPFEGALDALAQEPALAADRPPDLLNLHPLMESLAQENAPRLSFLDAQWKSLESWKREARPVYLRHLGYEPKPPPLGAQLLKQEQRSGFVIETLRIRGAPAYDIPARLLVPRQRSGRVPGVLALHCHSGQYVYGHEKTLSSASDSAHLVEFRTSAYGRPFAEALAQRGYVVLAIDAFYFGERRLRVEDMEPASAPYERELHARLRTLAAGSPEWITTVNRLCGRYEELTAKTLFAAGATWPGLLTWDDRRSLDYLCSRAEVDPERLGCVGLSLGGLRAARLIGAEPRIKAACVAGWMTEFAQQLKNHLRSHTWMAYVPGLHSALDLPDVAALTAPGALLVQQCSRDTLYPLAAMRASVEKLRSIYAKAGIPERFRGSFYDEPHSFRPAMQDEAFAWLSRFL